jgi:hypothetical protein
MQFGEQGADCSFVKIGAELEKHDVPDHFWS